MLPGGKAMSSEHNSELTARDLVLQISANVALFHIFGSCQAGARRVLTVVKDFDSCKRQSFRNNIVKY